MCSKRHVKRGFNGRNADARLELFTVFVNQRDQCDGCTANLRCEPCNVVVGGFRQGIEYLEAFQGLQTARFVVG